MPVYEFYCKESDEYIERVFKVADRPEKIEEDGKEYVRVMSKVNLCNVVWSGLYKRGIDLGKISKDQQETHSQQILKRSREYDVSKKGIEDRRANIDRFARRNNLNPKIAESWSKK